MEASTLDWLITLLALHIVALVGAIHLFKGAPCWMQKVSIFLLGLSFITCCAAYIAAIARVEYWWGFLIIAAALEHAAVLLYVFRVWWQGEQNKWNSSISSRSSPIS